jgi:hypothetical protein
LIARWRSKPCAIGELRREIRQRSDDRARAGQRLQIVVQLRNAEVEHHRLPCAGRALGEHHVGRLQVAMNDPRRVGRLDRRRYRQEDRSDGREGETACLGDPRGEVDAVQKLHHDERHAGFGPHVPDLDDVLVP